MVVVVAVVAVVVVAVVVAVVVEVVVVAVVVSPLVSCVSFLFFLSFLSLFLLTDALLPNLVSGGNGSSSKIFVTCSFTFASVPTGNFLVHVYSNLADAS